MTQDLLIEIGTEELPPASLRELERSFLGGIESQLSGLGIAFRGGVAFSTPRRLAVLMSGVALHRADRTTVRRGPALAAAYAADGEPSKALSGFARSCGVPISALSRESGDKGEWMVYRSVEPGRPTAESIPSVVEAALGDLPIAKRMRWGAGTAEFVRPVHWVCLVFGTEPVAGQVLGIDAHPATYGHRFHAPQAIAITEASQYPGMLRRHGFVEPCFETRRAIIAKEVSEIAGKIGLAAVLPEDLLEEVTALVEWPRAILGSFDEEFLGIPAEVLIETMQRNQRYFPVRDGEGRLMPYFVGVSNIDSLRPELVIQGNERVIRPRFADAKFFWEQGLKQPLEGYFGRLEQMVFQERLGSIADRSRRVAALGEKIAALVGASTTRVGRAAMLAKCDLATTMVGEFPSLQGTIGRYYAQRSGEDAEVCLAIEEHYFPRFSGAALPDSLCGQVLGLADRLDLLVGAFGIGLRPTGAKDPFGLRRAAIATLRILIERPLELELDTLLAAAVAGYGVEVLDPETAGPVREYIFGRLEGYFFEQGIASDTVSAVLAGGGTHLGQIARRVRALNQFRCHINAEALIAANRRIANLLAKRSGAAEGYAAPNPGLFVDPAEQRLWGRVQQLEAVMTPLARGGDFGGLLNRLSEVREDVDSFFDAVLVMADDPLVRENRLALLMRLRGLFMNVADVSLLK